LLFWLFYALVLCKSSTGIAGSGLTGRTKQVQDTHVSKDTVIKKDKSPVTGQLFHTDRSLVTDNQSRTFLPNP
jgi:hypothetical protein